MQQGKLTLQKVNVYFFTNLLLCHFLRWSHLFQLEAEVGTSVILEINWSFLCQSSLYLTEVPDFNQPMSNFQREFSHIDSREVMNSVMSS